MGARSQIAFLIALTLAIYLGSAFSPALLDDADSVHAEAAREMLESGDWVTLHVNGVRYLEKAPLLYWSMAAAFRLLGVWEMPARLPLALGALAFTLTLYGFGRFLFGPRAGFYAGLVGSTCIGVYLFTRILIPEILLALFITLAHFFFLAAQVIPLSERIGAPDNGSATGPRWGDRRALLCYGIYVSMALAVLTKGLIGVILPAAVIGLYLLMTGQLRLGLLREMRVFPGALLFLAVAAPWHLLAGLRNERFFWFYFMNEHFLRYLGRRVPPDYDTVPLLLFWGLHLVWLFPWTPFFVTAFREFPRSPRPHFDRDRILLFLWLWAGLVIAFFSFSTRQEYYSFPAYPALILLTAHALAEREQFPGNALLLAHGALFGLAALIAVGLGAMVRLSSRTVPEGDIAGLLTKNPKFYALSLGHIFDLTPQSFAALRTPALGAALALLLGGWVSLRLRMERRHLASTVIVALMAAMFFYWAHEALNVFAPYLSSKGLARSIAIEAAPGDRVVINGEYESGSTLNFYTGRQVYILNGRSADLWFGSFYPDAPRIFLEDRDLARLWRARGRSFLFTEADQLPKLQKLIGPARVWARSGGKVVLLNR